MRTLIFAAAFAALAAPMALAQSCETEPSFAGHRTANGVIRAQYNAVERGEWSNAVHFGSEVIESGASARTKTAAYNNLCAAYAALGDTDSAIAACGSALELRANSWRAYNNRGAAHWLAGNSGAALADFRAAEAASSGEDEVTANLAMTTCNAAS